MRLAYALSATLVLSLATNIALAVRRHAPAPSLAIAPVARCEPAEPVTRVVVDSVCTQRLSECEHRGWDLVARAVSPPLVAAPTVPGDAAAHATGRAEQSAALCTAAERALREDWEHRRAQMITDLAHSLGDPDEQRRDVDEAVTRIADAVHLDDAQRAAFAGRYGPLRLARIEQAHAALAQDPPDPSTLTEIARGLFADEDASVEAIGGAAAREAWRANQLEGRTVILAIAATLAGRDWDDATGW